MNSETIINTLTNLVGLAAVIFGLSKETTTTIVDALPSIVGGIMALCSTIAFLYHKRQARTAVFKEMASAITAHSGDVHAADAMLHTDKLKAAAQSVGLL